MPSALESHLLRRFELYLAAVTAVLFTVIATMVYREVSGTVILGISLGSLLVLQIAIQWADRERQRRLRARAIHEIREMLQDKVINQLTAIKVWAMMSSEAGELSEIFEEMDETIDEVAVMIQSLSEEQLNTWHLRYANSDAHLWNEDTAYA